MRVALLISNPHNHALIEALLDGVCDVVPRADDPFSTEIDLFIVDGPKLNSCVEELKRVKTAAEPLFLPVLLIASRPDILKTAVGLWNVVDDVVTRPINKRELEARVRTLLRARALAVSLQQSVDAYEREHVIATRLQHAALPNELPHIPGFEFDSFYEPAREEAKIGGDWYDAVCLNDGRILISLGDVIGTGLEAAITMASMRQAIRAVAQVYADPLTMLDAADRTLKEEQPDRIVTAFVGVVDPVSYTMKYASAGHPPPLLRERDGTITALHAQSLPLGLRLREDRAEANVQVAPGTLVLFYTDGLSEASRNPIDGEARMLEVLRDSAIVDAAKPATVIKQAVFDGLRQTDDVAILAMRVSDGERNGIRRWRVQSSDAQAAGEARLEFVEELREFGGDEDALFTSELIFGELFGNAVRYAAGPVEIALDTSGKAPVLHIMDSGRGFTLVPRLPSDLLSERGRGLFLIWTLGQDFNVDVRPGGGSHARVVLPVARSNEGGRWSRPRLPALEPASCGGCALEPSS